MMSSKKKFKIGTLLLTLLMAIAAMLFTVINTKEEAYGYSSNTDSDWCDSENNLLSEDGTKLNGDVLNEIAMAGGWANYGEMIADVKAGHSYTAQQFLTNPYYDDVSLNNGIEIRFWNYIDSNGDSQLLYWTPTYITTDKNGDVILDLYLSNPRVGSEIFKTKYNLWANDYATVKYPSNMYSTSYIRAFLNGTQYSTSATDLTSGTDAQSTVWKKFLEECGGFLVAPKDVAYQAKENAVTSLNSLYSLINDNYEVIADGNWDDDDGYSMSLIQNNELYGDWAEDLIWLPSIVEIGSIGNAGLWNLTNAQLTTYTSTSYYWVRSAAYNVASYGYMLSKDGEAGYYKGVNNTEYSVRPAIHLNLSSAKTDACMHEWETTYTTDGSQHWNECSKCGLKKNVYDHTIEYDYDDTEHWEHCSICGYVADDVVKSDHTIVYTDDTPDNTNYKATTISTHTGVCSVCGYTFTEQHHLVENTDDPVNGAVSKYVYADTGQHWLECKECGEIQVADHTMKDTYDKDPSGKHYSQCTECGYKTDEEKHDMVYEEVEDDEFTVDDKTGEITNIGSHTYYCTKGEYVAIESEQHTLEYVSIDDTTHYIKCDKCGLTLLESENHTFVNSDGTLTYVQTPTGHYFECTTCGYKTQEEEHKMKYVTGDTAGWHYYKCEVCGYEDESKRGPHDPKQHCNGDGHWWTCTVCEMYPDDHPTVEVHVMDTRKDASGHVRYCKLCEYVENEGVMTPHTYEMQKDDNYHWLKCSETDCGYISGKTAHVMTDYYETVKASCAQAGEQESQCTGYLYVGDKRVHCDHIDTKILTTNPDLHAAFVDNQPLKLVEAQAPTCVDAGVLRHYYCTACNKSYLDAAGVYEIKDTTDAALGHVANIDKANCQQNKYCLRCGTELEAKLAHTPDRQVATCTDPIKCTECGVVMTDKLPHTTQTPATCQTPAICDVCGLQYTGTTGHIPDIKAATCTQDQKCITCNAILAYATGHDYSGQTATCINPQVCKTCGIELAAATNVHTSSGAATCQKASVCTVCGKILQEKLAHSKGPEATCIAPQECLACGYVFVSPLGHISNEPATCEKPEICTRCGVEFTGIEGHELDIPQATCTQNATCQKCLKVIYYATGHDYSGTPADCKNDQLCVKCGAKLILADSTNHTYGPAATCTAPQKCTVCGATLNQMIDHVPDRETVTCKYAKLCRVCGTELEAKLAHTPGDAATCTTNQICQVCKEEIAPALGHTPGAEATCTAPQTCTVCKTELVAPLGHKYGNWEVIKQPTEEEHGIQQRICSVCNYLEQEEIVMPVSSEGGEGTVSGLPPLDNGEYDLEVSVEASSDLYNKKGTNEGYKVQLHIVDASGNVIGDYDQTKTVNLTLVIPEDIDETDFELYRVVDGVMTLIDPSEYTVNGRMVSIRTELPVELVFHNDEVATKSEAGVPWWIWLLIALAVLAIAAIIILIAKKRSHDDDEAVVADGYDDTETKRQLARQERRLRNLEQQSHPTDSDGFYDDVDKK